MNCVCAAGRHTPSHQYVFIVGALLSKDHRKIFAHIGKSSSPANFPDAFYTGELFSLCLSFLPAERKAVPICRPHDPSCAAPPSNETVIRRSPVFTAFHAVRRPRRGFSVISSGGGYGHQGHYKALTGAAPARLCF